MPEEIPDGHSLLIFTRSSHNSGRPYDWRLVAVPTGSSITDRIQEGKVVITKPIEEIDFLDSNSDYSFKLSQGGLEYDADGTTKSIQKVAYNY